MPFSGSVPAASDSSGNPSPTQSRTWKCFAKSWPVVNSVIPSGGLLRRCCHLLNGLLQFLHIYRFR